jgi:PAS domain S-box-containing protein
MARILLVEDEPLLLLTMRDHLADQGHEVSGAANGLTGREMFSAMRPDLVILDLVIPGMPGLELLSAIRAMDADVAIVIVSGAGGMSEVITALRLGATDFLTKPLTNLEILDHAVEKALERAAFARRRQRYEQELEDLVRERTRELAEANAALRESRTLFKELVENIQAIFWVRDMETGALLYASPTCETILGMPGPEALRDAETFVAHVHPEDRAKVRGATRGRDSGRSLSVTYRFLRPDGKTIWISSRRFPIQDETGRVVRAAGVAEDVTARVLAEMENREKDRQLVQADKMISLGIMAAGVAHEINNPNHLIGLNAASLLDLWPDLRRRVQAGSDEEPLAGLPCREVMDMVGNMLSGIAAGSGRITGIVRRMKDFARPDDGAMDRRVDMRRVLEQALELTRSRLEKATHALTVDLPEGGIALVRGSPSRLEQVVVNLLINAADALPDPDRGIRAALWEAGRTVVLTVRDEGTGIDPEHLERIADPFFTTKRERGGLGLGLSVSMNIVQALGGELTFHSRPGQGTLATLTLPALENP